MNTWYGMIARPAAAARPTGTLYRREPIRYVANTAATPKSATVARDAYSLIWPNARNSTARTVCSNSGCARNGENERPKSPTPASEPACPV